METNSFIFITLCNPNENILHDWKINYVFGVCWNIFIAAYSTGLFMILLLFQQWERVILNTFMLALLNFDFFF
jgi:hypothetical protein